MNPSTADMSPGDSRLKFRGDCPVRSPNSLPVQSQSPPLAVADTAKRRRRGYPDEDPDNGIGERSEAPATSIRSKQKQQGGAACSPEHSDHDDNTDLADHLRDSLHVGDLVLEKADALMTSTRTGDTSATTRDSHDTLADSNHHEQPRSSEDEDDVADNNGRNRMNQMSVASAPVRPASSRAAIPAVAPFVRSRTRDSAMSSSRRARQSDDDNSRPKLRMPPRDGKRTHWHPSAAGNSSSRKTGTIHQHRRDQTDHGRQRRSKSNANKNSNIKNANDDADDLFSKPGEIDVIHNGSLEDDDDEESVGFATNRSQRSHTSSASPIPRLTDNRIHSFMKDYYEDFDSIFQNGSTVKAKKAAFEAFFDQYYTKDIVWIRSSGNPIGRDGLADMLCDDIEIDKATLVSMDSVQLLAGGLAATVVYTADLKFLFRGQPQSDRTVLTSVLQVTGSGEILIAHVHWSVGKPIPTETRWESEN